MKNKIFIAMTIATVLVFISGTSILAVASTGPGTDADPVITLSYLNNTFRALVSQDIASALNTLTTRITAAETKIANELEAAKKNTANTFKFITMSNNQTINLPEGSEVMLRSGGLTVTAGSLVKISGDSATVAADGILAANNMYFTVAAATIRASGTTTVWIRSS